ncbi:alpha/beta hydrolase [Algivirga pacifica]|uniref:Alpha/beta hydrolase n=1 Tax=Algivirga pacifica TaxID=1162670 RepID=A0ABP9DQ86_9BACT
MKKLFPILFLLVFTASSCSYLPEKVNYSPTGISISENTEYIQMTSEDIVSDRALIYVPGSGVDPHAYMSLMENVVRAGNTVLILKMPANLAILEWKKPLEIVEEMKEFKTWYIAGHSLGGVTSQILIHSYPDVFNGLIVLGVYPSDGHSLADWDRNVLSIYADNDELASVEEVEENKPYLPTPITLESIEDMDALEVSQPSTIYYMIEGGNHALFGNYGAQTGDGVATISLEEQQRQTSTLINKFIDWNENR